MNGDNVILGSSKKIEYKANSKDEPKKQTGLKKCADKYPVQWSTFVRLNNLDNRSCRTRDEYLRNKITQLDLPLVVELPRKDEIKCRCIDHVSHSVRNVCCYSPALVLNQVLRRQMIDRWMKETRRFLLENERYKFPLGTLVVRWRLSHNLPGYDFTTLHQMFSKFGEVIELRKTSPNTALVIFRDLCVACDVVNSRQLGYIQNRLQSRFWHKTMENKAFFNSEKGLKIKKYATCSNLSIR